MRKLTTAEILTLWERGLHETSEQRALTLLGAVCQDESRTSLANLSIGARDARLLELRQLTFGPRLSSLSHCPECAEPLQADFEISHLQTHRKREMGSTGDPPVPSGHWPDGTPATSLVEKNGQKSWSAASSGAGVPPASSKPQTDDQTTWNPTPVPDGGSPSGTGHWPVLPSYSAAPFELDINHLGITARVRLPDTNDLETIAALPNPAQARLTLLARCIIDPYDTEGRHLPMENLPDDFITEVATRISRADPQADVELALACPACACSWSVPFDIASYFWMELQFYARRLLREVHELATFYHWRETDILALTTERRSTYLELVRG